MTMQSVSLSALEASAANPRRKIDRKTIERLAASIRTDGLLHNLVVSPTLFRCPIAAPLCYPACNVNIARRIKLWVADITYVHLAEEFAYLVIMSWSWKIGQGVKVLPASCSRRMPMICSSLNRLPLIVRPSIRGRTLLKSGGDSGAQGSISPLK